MSGLLSGLFPHLFGGTSGAAPTNIVPAEYPSPAAMSPVNMGLGGLLGGGRFGSLIHPDPTMLGMGMGMMNGQGWANGIGQGLQTAAQLQQQQRQAAMNQQLMQAWRARMGNSGIVPGNTMGPQPSPNLTLPGVY